MLKIENIPQKEKIRENHKQMNNNLFTTKQQKLHSVAVI